VLGLEQELAWAMRQEQELAWVWGLWERELWERELEPASEQVLERMIQ
jgi:hypothetical protein